VRAALRLRRSDYARGVDALRITPVYQEAIVRGHVRRDEVSAAVATAGVLRSRTAAVLTVHDMRSVDDAPLLSPYTAAGAERSEPAAGAGRARLDHDCAGRDTYRDGHQRKKRAMRESRDAKHRRAKQIIKQMERAYPDAKIALDFTTPLELVVATILAAQCT